MPKLSILQRHLWNDASLPWLEEHLQIAIAERFYQLEKSGLAFTFAADMNAARRSRNQGAKLKAAGMRAGETDIRVYLNDGRLGMIELKRKRGRLSEEQKKRHKKLRSLGHDVRVLRAACPAEAVDAAVKILDEWIC